MAALELLPPASVQRWGRAPIVAPPQASTRPYGRQSDDDYAAQLSARVDRLGTTVAAIRATVALEINALPLWERRRGYEEAPCSPCSSSPPPSAART